MKRGSATLLLIAICLVMAGCGGGSNKTAVPPTSTTVLPTTTTTTTISPAQRAAIKAAAAAAQLASDKTAIQHVVEFLNTSFRANWQTGFNSRAAANYYVWSGKYTAAQCIAYWSRPAPFIEDALTHPETIVATPDWVEAFGGKPKGRVYSLNIDYTVSLADGTYPQRQTQTVHVTVIPDGNAKMFFACTP